MILRLVISILNTSLQGINSKLVTSSRLIQNGSNDSLKSASFPGITTGLLSYKSLSVRFPGMNSELLYYSGRL